MANKVETKATIADAAVSGEVKATAPTVTEATVPAAPSVRTAEQIKADMAAAYKANDLDLMGKLALEYQGLKAQAAKAVADKLEAVRLADTGVLRSTIEDVLGLAPSKDFVPATPRPKAASPAEAAKILAKHGGLVFRYDVASKLSNLFLGTTPVKVAKTSKGSGGDAKAAHSPAAQSQEGNFAGTGMSQWAVIMAYGSPDEKAAEYNNSQGWALATRLAKRAKIGDYIAGT